MGCMKCGRELEGDQVFCETCLLDMEKYPVEPGTAVQLPRRQSNAGIRKQAPRRRNLTPEEQIQKLKKRIRVLTIALSVTVLLLLAAIYPTVNFFLRSYYLRPGQNYTAITTVTPAQTQPAPAD